MPSSSPSSIALALALFGATGPALADDTDVRVYGVAFFETFSPQTALEIIERLPGFSLEEADDERGLSLGGTNVLLNGRPITGKGEAATNQIAQIPAANVVQIEIRDAATLDLPGYSGLVANIITEETRFGGSWQWNPEFKDSSAPALANGSITLSGEVGDLDLSIALNSTAVRVDFAGPETLRSSDGVIFENRYETLSIAGNQPVLSGSLTWTRPSGEIFNAKASLGQLDLEREQVSASSAATPRGFSGSNIGAFSQLQTSTRFDADYTLPAFGGSLILITVASNVDDDARTRLSIDSDDGQRLARSGFDEVSRSTELVARFEQSWGDQGRSWQLAGEGAFNALDLETERLAFSLDNSDAIISQTSSATTIEELRTELSLTHSRRLSERADLQISAGAEVSTLSQGSVERAFVRPKGFAAYTLRPNSDWTLLARLARKVGQLRFRDFAASVSLFEGVETGSNTELVPEQSWVLTGRVERRFTDGHIASLEVEHERITDLVDRIPLASGGDAVGNIPEATQTRIQLRATLLGAPVGLEGVQLDLRGAWISSSVEDPVEGFARDINDVRIRDLRIDFRHDLPGQPWSYGFTLQGLELSPVYRANFIQFRNVPTGGLTPGTNIIFVEHNDVFGLRARISVSEFVGHESNFSRTLYDGRRDAAQIDRIEQRSRSLQGPYFRLGLGRTF